MFDDLVRIQSNYHRKKRLTVMDTKSVILMLDSTVQVIDTSRYEALSKNFNQLFAAKREQCSISFEAQCSFGVLHTSCGVSERSL